MRGKSARVAFASAALLLASAQGLAAYELVDLGVRVAPSALNDARTVVGNVNEVQTDPNVPPVFHPFIWKDGVLTRFDVPGWPTASLADINASGVAVGQVSGGDPSRPSAPFIYQDGVVTFIPVPGIGAAGAINDSGMIGGFVQSVQGGPPYTYGGNIPFVYQSGIVTLLPSLGGSGGGVTDISASGVVVGELNTADNSSTQAFEWTAGSTTFLPAPGSFAFANGINSAGVVVGASNFGNDVTTDLFVWQNGAPQDLGRLGDAVMTQGFAINDSGDIVGYAAGPTGANAFLYRNGAFTTLDSLVPGSAWHFVTALDINGRGDIVGMGIPPGTTDVHGYLLVATPTVAELMAQLEAAIANAGLHPSDVKGLVSLLDAYVASHGANRQGLCNGLARFTASVSHLGLPPAEAQSLRQLTSALGAQLGC